VIENADGEAAMEAVDLWPTELRGVMPAKTLTSVDGLVRIHFWQRKDGRFQFLIQNLDQDEDGGQPYAIWRSKYPPSGFFADLDSAEQDARRSSVWSDGPVAD
jgi:hypothetical protein